MTEAERYEGYGWIKAQRAHPVELNGVRYVPEAHHIEETSFLIAEVRMLAAKVDSLRSRSSDLATDTHG